jgi:outer membrane protein assembly factor BamB
LSGISDGTAGEVELGELDADIVWGFDMATELGVFPHNVTSSSVVAADGIIFASTSNGVDYSHKEIPVPNAPCLIALDQKTGELLGEEGSGIGNNIMHCNWSSPAFAEGLVYFGAGDGYLYAYDPKAVPGTGEWEGLDVLPEVWKVDGNAPEYRVDENGEPIKYATYDGPSEFITTPVHYKGRIYAAIGQDPEHGEGVGMLSCVDAKTGEEVWTYKDINRTISTPSIWNDILWIADYSGQVHCLDANTGEVHWVHDTLSHIWGSTLVADGMVYIGNEDGELTILKADKGTDGEAEEIGLVQFHAPVFSSAVAANGVLYVQTQNHLYAFEKKE